MVAQNYPKPYVPWHLVNSCVRYLQKINFLTVKELLFLHVLEMGNENENII